MKKFFLFLSAALLTSAALTAQIRVNIYDDCSLNGATRSFAEVKSTSGRSNCEYVQLWADGPKWATFNVGATITDYTNLTVGADPVPFNTHAEEAPYYNTANVGGLYGVNTPNKNGRKTTWTYADFSAGSTDVATALWGDNWRTPTKAQMEALLSSDNTTWTWCDGGSTQYVPGCRLKGYKVSGIGAYADKSIFLPGASLYSPVYETVMSVGAPWYMTTTIDEEDEDYYYCLTFFAPSSPELSHQRKESGISVRAIYVGD